jgi:GAF domain-containing protein
MLCELGPIDGRIYDSLREQYGAALRGLLLVEQRDRHTLQLQTAVEVGRAASGVLDPDELMQRVVDLVLNRLDLYYAGIFVIDESGEWTGEPKRWAVLRAGTGQAGRQMLARGHKLELGGESMIGQCTSRGKGRIALDVGQEAVRFDNPLLPHTRSELALPLSSRGRIIGAMTIQSAQPSAFSQQDIAALQVMADQLANAIETSRLFRASQEAVERIQTLYAASQRLAAASQAQEMVAAVAESVRIDAVDRVVLWSVERDDRDEVVAYESIGSWHRDGGQPPLAVGVRSSVAEFPAARLASGADALFFEDVLADERVDKGAQAAFAQQEVRSLALLPVQSGHRSLGLLMVIGQAPHPFTMGEQRLLASLAGQMVVGLERLNLLTQAQERLRHEQVLREVAERVRSSVDVETVMRTAVREAGRALGRPAFIYLGSEEELAVSQPSHLPWSPRGTVPGKEG